MKAVQIEEHGSPNVLKLVEVPIPSIRPDQILIKIEAIGVNFADIYDRKGTYSVKLPHILGKEGAGVIVELGTQVANFAIGDRVGFAYIPKGAYAEYVAVKPSDLVYLPSDIDSKISAACLLQGLTAYFLTHDTVPLNPNHTILIHGAAGGVGLLAIQLAKLLGATVIGTVSTEAKAELAKQAGADFVIRHDCEDIVKSLMEFTKNEGVNVVYDSVGAPTFEASLEVLKSHGVLVVFGQSSGIVPILDLNKHLGRLGKDRGSFFVTRPIIQHYISNPDNYQNRASSLFSYIKNGQLKLRIGDLYDLSSAKLAHEALENRSDRGKFLLIPDI